MRRVRLTLRVEHHLAEQPVPLEDTDFRLLSYEAAGGIWYTELSSGSPEACEAHEVPADGAISCVVQFSFPAAVDTAFVAYQPKANPAYSADTPLFELAGVVD